MKLVVDASVAVKWFVAEQWTEESRELLASRIDRHAPDLILAETTNVLWKKARRGEIKDPQAYFAEAANLPDVLVLHRCQDLFVRASAIAVDIDHPVYDCIYLACAEAEGVPLVTADQWLKDVSRAGPGGRGRVAEGGEQPAEPLALLEDALPAAPLVLELAAEAEVLRRQR